MLFSLLYLHFSVHMLSSGGETLYKSILVKRNQGDDQICSGPIQPSIQSQTPKSALQPPTPRLSLSPLHLLPQTHSTTTNGTSTAVSPASIPKVNLAPSLPKRMSTTATPAAPTEQRARLLTAVADADRSGYRSTSRVEFELKIEVAVYATENRDSIVSEAFRHLPEIANHTH